MINDLIDPFDFPSDNDTRIACFYIANIVTSIASSNSNITFALKKELSLSPEGNVEGFVQGNGMQIMTCVGQTDELYFQMIALF